MTGTAAIEPELITTALPPIGHLRINRPKSLNALTIGVITGIHAALDAWCDDPNILAVIIDGAGDRAFCAGGDLRSIYAARGNEQFGYDIFLAEYQLNYKIANYPKPIVAIMNGITMGGGAGIAVYASHRIVTEHTKFAMPECGIGLFPDIGASWFLQKSPGLSGLYLALTGDMIDAADAIYARVADHYVPWDNMPGLHQKLATIQSQADIGKIINQFQSMTPTPPSLRQNQSCIDDYFAHATSLLGIYLGLPADEFGQNVKRSMDKNSPLSMGITFESMRRAKGRDLAAVLNTDLILSQSCLAGGEFYEGIRAAVIDKDRKANWNPTKIGDLNPDAIDRHFIPPNDRDYTAIGRL